MATSGQTLNDRINAARYALAGQGLARCVCKATTEEIIGPKKKHLDYLIACTYEPNVSIPQLANLLIERTNHIYWVVVFKALVTVHHLMSYGNERFTQYLASSNYSFELSTFLDKTAARDFSMSTFIRRYSRYINEKALSYRLLAFDFCKVKRGNEGVLRVMPIDRLLKTLPILQNQLDALIEFDCSANDLNNGVINACFMLLFRDLIGLFACHNDGIINLLNKYFNLNRKMCREAFDLYKKFLVRMDKVSEFLRVAEVVGIEKDEIPDLRRTPSSLIDALEQHLQNLESNKKILKHQQPGATNNNNNLKLSPANFSALGSLTPPSSRRASPGSQQQQQPSTLAQQQSSVSQVQSDDFSITSFKDEEVRKALEEEARVLSRYGTGDSKLTTSGSNGNKTYPGSNSPTFAVSTSIKSMDDIFGDSDSFATNTNATKGSSSNGLDNNGSAFDNLSITSSSSSNAKLRSDLESIKSAAPTLEPTTVSTKKASDELFSLLDGPTTAPTASTNPLAQGTKPTSGLIAPPPPSLPKQSQKDSVNPMNLFATPTPFDIQAAAAPTAQTNSNGFLPTLKPGNPFPDVSNDFANGSALLKPIPQAPISMTSGPQSGNSVFKSGVSAANYTNLGGLEGFGDLLQPMSSTNKASGSQANSFGQTSNNKSSFAAGPGLSSTGLFKGDLDSTLANLAQNLTFDDINKTKK